MQEGYRRRCASFCNFLSIVLIVDLWFRSLFVIPLGCVRGFYRATLRTPKVLVLFFLVFMVAFIYENRSALYIVKTIFS